MSGLPKWTSYGLGLLFSAIASFYLVHLLLMLIGSKPEFLDFGSTSVACGILLVFNLIGLLCRRIVLVGFLGAAIGLAFLVPFLFTLRGTFQFWAIQFGYYLLLPIVNAFLLRGFTAYLSGEGE